MGNFTQTFMHESEFDGDKIRVELRRLKRKHVAKFSPFMAQASGGEFRVDLKDQMPVLDVLETILPECVVKIDGLKDKANNPLKLEDIIEDFYFMPLFMSWMTALFNNSFTKADDEKKSEPQPPADSSGESAATS